MRLGVLAGVGRDWQTSLANVQAAESIGYELVCTGEAWGPSSIPWMTLLAAHTEKIHIGTSILNIYSRSPGAIAQEFAMLEMLSGGRMVCGLGSSGHRVIEHFHGVKFETPLRRLREYTEIINMLLSGQKLEYQGKIYSLQRGFELSYEKQRDHVPVYIAAITPKSIFQTGEIADGIFPIHWPKQHFTTLRDQLAEGAAKSGRTGDALTIAPFTNVFVLDGSDDEKLWQAARQPLFHYINRMGDFYWNMLASNGYEAEVMDSRAAWKDRNMEGAMEAISDKMVRDIQVIGPLESCAEQLAERSTLGADVQMIQMPGGSPEDVQKRLETLASAG